MRLDSERKGHFECESCGKVFTLKGNLRRHEKMHTEAKANTCSVCGKKFHRTSDLTTHMRTHTGEKPFACIHCGKGFARISDLRSHERTHLGIKNFVCDVCGRKFSRKHDCEKHKRQHEEQEGAQKRPCTMSRSTSQELCCDNAQNMGQRCSRRSVVIHEGHYDFLLECGTLQCRGVTQLDVDANSEGTASQCPDEAHQLREEQLDTQQTSMVANSNMGGSALQAEWDLEAARTSPICPVKSCAAGVEAECEHVQQALQINHEGHIDYVMDGHLWHKRLAEDGFVFENHGSFTLVDTHEDFLTFFESLERL